MLHFRKASWFELKIEPFCKKAYVICSMCIRVQNMCPGQRSVQTHPRLLYLYSPVFGPHSKPENTVNMTSLCVKAFLKYFNVTVQGRTAIFWGNIRGNQCGKRAHLKSLSLYVDTKSVFTVELWCLFKALSHH